MQPSASTVPKHVGLIMDGNRRFAKRLMLKPWQGHEWGAKKMKEVLEWAKDLGVEELTFYAFSVENFDRPKDEFKFLMDLALRTFEDYNSPENLAKLNEESVRMNFIGRTWMFPEDIQEAMHKLMEATKQNSKYIVNFAVAYGGRAEILDATRKVAQLVKDGKLDVDKINDDVFQKALYIESEPDLIIRTSGEHRTSGFLLWQSSYSEFFVCDNAWPEFTKEDLVHAITDYSSRNRRFGR